MSAKILWASQTGNCEAISLRLYNDCLQRNINCERYCLQELGINLSILSHEVLVIIVSSTGDGELPENGQKFYRWIRSQESIILSGIKYTILGLGDSNYSTFQGGPKTIERLMKKLGAKAFYPRGEADEQLGLENIVEYWIEGLFSILQYEVEQLKLVQREEIKINAEEIKFVHSKIIEKKILSEKNSSRQIVELKLSINQNYIPGTAIFMHPQNSKDKIERLINYIHLLPQTNITVIEIPKALSHRCKSDISLMDYFIKYVDINSPLKSRTAIYLANLLQEEEEKNDFLSCIDQTKLSMPAAYNLECILSQYHSWGSFLLKEFLETMPILSPRNYSISSSPISSPSSITIVFTVTGVCTRYLNSITNFDSHIIEYAISVNQGSFWKGIESSDKILMIATGTGISPFKGILEHLSHIKSKSVWVIYGCRNSIKNAPEHNYDHIYQHEIITLL